VVKGDSYVFGDLNGDRTPDFKIHIVGVTMLSASDFILQDTLSAVSKIDVTLNIVVLTAESTDARENFGRCESFICLSIVVSFGASARSV
jgi:hypothetical protein